MIQSVVNKLIDLGYNPVVEDNNTYYTIKFKSFGFDNFKDKHKDIIRDICGKSLMEFYYGSDKQYIYIRRNLRKEKLNKINVIFLENK